MSALVASGFALGVTVCDRIERPMLPAVNVSREVKASDRYSP
ncbi:MAG: hypothetical protein AAFX40_19310 [Cyanobacteria bacterium J06639_1]